MPIKWVNLSVTGNLCLELIKNPIVAAIHLVIEKELLERNFYSKWHRFFIMIIEFGYYKILDGLTQGMTWWSAGCLVQSVAITTSKSVKTLAAPR